MFTYNSRLAFGIFFVLCVLLLSTAILLHIRLQAISLEMEGLQKNLSKLESAMGSLKKEIEQGALLRRLPVAGKEETEFEPLDPRLPDELESTRVQLRNEIGELRSELAELRLRQGQTDARLSEVAAAALPNTRTPWTGSGEAGAATPLPRIPSVVLDKLTPDEREAFKSAVLDVLREKQLEDTYHAYMQTAEQMVKHYTTWLSLSSEQEAKVSSVVYRQYREMFEIQYGSMQPADRSTLGAALNECQLRHFDEIATHLEPWQRSKFDEWRRSQGYSLEVGSTRKVYSKIAEE